MKQPDIATLMPICGLFGTVVGIVRSFSRIAEHETSGPAAVFGGFTDALAVTALLLLLAIALVSGYNRAAKAKK